MEVIMSIVNKIRTDENWKGQEVLLYLTHHRRFSGLLRDYGDGWIDVGGVIFNTDKIVSISKLECKCRDR
jgi:hypothetical protein